MENAPLVIPAKAGIQGDHGGSLGRARHGAESRRRSPDGRTRQGGPHRPILGVMWRRIFVSLALLPAVALAGCGLSPDTPSARETAAMTGGDPDRGRQKIRDYGCDACHTIPGVRGADRTVGPPLSGIASRMFIAGLLANNPDNMILWIRNPPAIDPRTAMPYLGVTDSDARDIAAYLYGLD